MSAWHKLVSFWKRQPQLRKWSHQIGWQGNLWSILMNNNQFIKFQEWRAKLLTSGPGRNEGLSLLTSHIRGISKYCGSHLLYYVPRFLVFLPCAVLPWSDSPSSLPHPLPWQSLLHAAVGANCQSQSMWLLCQKPLPGLLVTLEQNPVLPCLFALWSGFCLVSSVSFLSFPLLHPSPTSLTF